MSGFPTRHLRSAFGSVLRDSRPVENPELERSAFRANLAERDCAAASLLLPRASLIAEWIAASSSFRIYHQEEAWNVDHSQAHPALTYYMGGMYRYTLAESYLDADGIVTQTDVIAARVTGIAITGGPSVTDWNCSINGLQVTVSLFDGFGSLIDARFWLEVF